MSGFAMCSPTIKKANIIRLISGSQKAAEREALVSAQAAREPDRQPTHEPARVARLQPQERSRLLAQGAVPAILGIRLRGLGRQVPGCLVHPRDALTEIG